MAMNLCMVLILLVIAGGCASSRAIHNNYEKMVNISDGVDEQEAKIMAQKDIIAMYEQRDYRVTAPDVKDTPEALKYPDYWFVVFGHNWLSPISTDPLAKTYTELKEAQYLVVINKESGEIVFSGQWYSKRADHFDWVFYPKNYSAGSLNLPPGEAGNPVSSVSGGTNSIP